MVLADFRCERGVCFLAVHAFYQGWICVSRLQCSGRVFAVKFAKQEKGDKNKEGGSSQSVPGVWGLGEGHGVGGLKGRDVNEVFYIFVIKFTVRRV